MRKDKTTRPSHYIVILKSRDADDLEQVFKEFTAEKLSRVAKPALRKALSILREAVATLCDLLQQVRQRQSQTP